MPFAAPRQGLMAKEDDKRSGQVMAWAAGYLVEGWCGGSQWRKLRPTNRWSRRGYRRDETANVWEVTLRVGEGLQHGPPRGSAQPLGTLSKIPGGT